jgi:hypothetical protein
MKETTDISITIGLLEAEIDSLKDAYKNCKFSALKREYSTQLVSHKQALKMLKQVADLEPLINQEVEKRIAERMPSDEEIIHEATDRYVNKVTGHVRSNLWAVFRKGAKWSRSRMMKINSSQKTEGGGE